MRFYLIAILTLSALASFGQNTWNNSSVETNSTNGVLRLFNGNLIIGPSIGSLPVGSSSSWQILNYNTTRNGGLMNYTNFSGNGSLYGFYNYVSTSNTNGYNRYGIYNVLSTQSTSGAGYGIYSKIESSPGLRYGIYSEIATSGNGNKYGLYTTITGNGTEPRIGVYSSCSGVNAKAAFFLGEVEIQGTQNITGSGLFQKTTVQDSPVWAVYRTDLSRDVFQVRGNGTIYAMEINVMAGLFPDYVFAPDYDLMSIYDLQNYIDQNHHLPNIPPANEVEANGLKLGELNTKLVEKVEELTLYIIQQQEQIDALKKEVENLKH